MKAVLLFISILLVGGFTIPDETGSNFTKAQATTFLDAHNEIRGTIGNYAQCEWSVKIATTAQEWADYLKSKGGKLQHRPKKGKYATNYGENLALIPITTQRKFLEKSIAIWSEEMPPDIRTTLNIPLTKQDVQKYGHYLQMIWGATRFIGAGWADLGNGYAIVVCNYDPQGNIIGHIPWNGAERSN